MEEAMGTLLTETIYNELCTTRENLVQEFGLDNVSGIHGDRLLNHTEQVRSLYVLGIATAADYATDVPPNFNAARSYSEQEWQEHATESANVPFWQFVSGLTKHIVEPVQNCFAGGPNLMRPRAR
jgi:hypothetical protein